MINQLKQIIIQIGLIFLIILIRMLSIGGSGLGQTNVLLNLIKHQRPDINTVYLHVKDPFESKHQLLINEREKVGIKTIKNPET